MKRKLVKNGRGVIMNIPTGILENLNVNAGDEVNIRFNIDTGYVEINRIPEYCTQREGLCFGCSLVNYGKDCANNPVKGY